MLAFHLARVGVRLACCALLAIAASCLWAEGGSAGDPSQLSSTSASKPDYRFEVASIRPVGPPTGLPYGDPRLKPQYSPGLYREEQVSLAHLVFEAYRIKQAYELETPRWMESAYFTLNATVPKGATKADIPIMLQQLLEDRFGLKYHHVTRHTLGYELVVVKSGLGLTKSSAPNLDKTIVKGPPVEFNKDGTPQFTKDARSGQLCYNATCVWRGRNETMKQMAEQLAGTDKLNAPVVDATQLEGAYDFTLTYTPETTLGRGRQVLGSLSTPAGPDATAAGDTASPPIEHPSLRDALQEQLGLKLRSSKGVPVDVMVIDAANREPTEN